MLDHAPGRQVVRDVHAVVAASDPEYALSARALEDAREKPVFAVVPLASLHFLVAALEKFVRPFEQGLRDERAMVTVKAIACTGSWTRPINDCEGSLTMSGQTAVGTTLLARVSGLIYLALLGAVLVPSKAEAASSTFTSDREGWMVVDLPNPVTGHAPAILDTVTPGWNASGGHPGGYISQQDPSVNLFLFSAPTGFLGNQSASYGLVLSFDMNEDMCCTPNSVPAVILVGQTLTLYSSQLSAPSEWTSYDLLLRGISFTVNSPSGPSASDAQVLSVLTDLQALYLEGDWIEGTDTASLDNVSLPMEQPTPIQSSTWGRVKALFSSR